jgi:hypothetical protein
MEASGQFQDPVALLPGKSSHPPRIGNGAGRSQSQSGRRESKSGGPAHILVTILIELPQLLYAAILIPEHRVVQR